MNIAAFCNKTVFSCGLMTGLMLPVGAYSAEPVDCGDTPIHLAFFEYGLRYYIEDGKPKGMDKDFVEELAARSGCSFFTEVMTKSRIYADLETGNLDMSPTGVKTPDRADKIWFIWTVKTKFLSVVNKAHQQTAQTAQDFLNANNLVLGVIRGAQYSQGQQNFIEELRKQARLDESKDMDTSVSKLRQGQIDAILSQVSVYRRYFKVAETDNPIIFDWFPDENGILAGLMLSKARFSEPEAAYWRALVQEMHRDGTLERINAKYVSDSEARQILDFSD